MDQQRLIAILSERIAQAKIRLEEKQTTRKNKLTGLMSAIALMSVIGLYGIAPADKTIPTTHTATLYNTIAEQRTLIDEIGRIEPSKTLQKVNDKTISSCVYGLIQATNRYVFCKKLPI